MFVKRNTCWLVFLLCSLTLWCGSTSAGSSFLSPSQKPQGKPPRLGRQVMEERSQPAVDDHIPWMRPPVDVGFPAGEEDFEQCSLVLQVIRRLLGSTEAPTESPSQL